MLSPTGALTTSVLNIAVLTSLKCDKEVTISPPMRTPASSRTISPLSSLIPSWKMKATPQEAVRISSNRRLIMSSPSCFKRAKQSITRPIEIRSAPKSAIRENAVLSSIELSTLVIVSLRSFRSLRRSRRTSDITDVLPRSPLKTSSIASISVMAWWILLESLSDHARSTSYRSSFTFERTS